MLVEQVDAVGLEPLERRVGDGADTLRPAVHARRGIPVLETELACDHDLVAERSHRLADQLLIREWTVGLGAVKERHAALEGLADQRDRCLLLQRGAVTEAQAHATEAECGDFETALPECALLHDWISSAG